MARSSRRSHALRLISLEDRSLPSSVQGTIFDDANRNQIFDSGESGLSGWTVYVDTNQNSVINPGELTAVTDVNGGYSIDLSSLPNGSYSLGLDLQPGSGGRWVKVAPWLGSVNTITEPSAIRDAGVWFQPYVSVQPDGAETLVNVTTANMQGADADQGGVAAAPNAVASNAAGDYVVAWRSVDTASSKVMVRLFHADGTAATGEITVASNEMTWRNPTVAIADNGRFVVAWTKANVAYFDDASTFARVYNPDGTPATGVITVAAASGNAANLMSDVAMDAAGNFAVLYRNWRPTSGNAESATIRLQRYSAAGAAIGGAITVADTTAYMNWRQTIAMDSTGRFVVAWDSGLSRTVLAQRYSATAQKVGAEIVVASSSSHIGQSFVALNNAGRFVVTWAAPGGFLGAQVYDWGTPVGGNISLLEPGYVTVGYPSVACDIDDANNVTFTWGGRVASGSQGTATLQEEVAFRRLTGAGVLEPTYLVNTTTQGFQGYPGLASLGNDKFVAVWQGRGAGDADGIFMQRIAENVGPPPPTMISIDDVGVTEGNAGSQTVTFTVSLSVALPDPVSVQFLTGNDSAQSGADFLSTGGTLMFAPGEINKTISVDVLGDRLAEANETFFVNLSNPVHGGIADGQGVGTIVDDEPRLTISDVAQNEGAQNTTSSFTFNVTLSAAYDQPVTVSYNTANGTATTGNSDYVAKSGILTFNPGETQKTITVTVNGDKKRESDEEFYVDLSGNSSNSLFMDSRGIGTILNDD